MAWTKAANEGGTIQLDRPTKASYGADDGWIEVVLPTGEHTCSNETFGRDPKVGTVKACYLSDEAVEAPTQPEPAPSPAAPPAPGLPPHYRGSDIARVNLEREVPATDIEWLRAAGLTLDWGYGYWTVMQGLRAVTVGLPTPAEAVQRARVAWAG